MNFHNCNEVHVVDVSEQSGAAELSVCFSLCERWDFLHSIVSQSLFVILVPLISSCH